MKNKSLLIAVVIIILAIGLSIVFRSAKQPQMKKLPQNVLLNMTTVKQSVSPGEEFSVRITLDSQAQEVAAADIVVNFNPSFLKVKEVTSADFFSTYPINQSYKSYVKISGVAAFDGKNIIYPKGK